MAYLPYKHIPKLNWEKFFYQDMYLLSDGISILQDPGITLD